MMHERTTERMNERVGGRDRAAVDEGARDSTATARAERATERTTEMMIERMWRPPPTLPWPQLWVLLPILMMMMMVVVVVMVVVMKSLCYLQPRSHPVHCRYLYYCRYLYRPQEPFVPAAPAAWVGDSEPSSRNCARGSA